MLNTRARTTMGTKLARDQRIAHALRTHEMLNLSRQTKKSTIQATGYASAELRWASAQARAHTTPSRTSWSRVSETAQGPYTLGIDRVGGLRRIPGLEDPVADVVSCGDGQQKRTMCRRRRLGSNIWRVISAIGRIKDAPQPDQHPPGHILRAVSGHMWRDANIRRSDPSPRLKSAFTTSKH